MSFSNSILAGTKLVREAIESPNFVPGTSGWSIRRDGSAEFSDVDVRGTLESSNYVPGTSGWHLGNDGSAEMRDLTMQGTWRVENILSTPGYIEGGILGNIPYLKFNGLVGLGQVSAIAQMGDVGGLGRLRVGVEPQTSQASLVFVQNRGIAIQQSPGGRSVLFDNTDGYLKPGSWAPWVQNDWIPLNGANNWVSSGSNPAACKVFADGILRFRGAFVNNVGAAGLGSGVFDLPGIAYRPQSMLSQRFYGANTGDTQNGGNPILLEFRNGFDRVILGRATTSAVGVDISVVQYPIYII